MKSPLNQIDLLRPRGHAALVAVVLALAVAGTGAFRLASTGEGVADGVAFELSGRQVSVDELDERVHTLSALYSIKAPKEKDKLSTFRRDAAKSMAVSLILDDEAEKRSVKVSDKDAGAGLDAVIQSNLGGDEKAFTTFLGDNGISRQDVLDEIIRTLKTSELYKDVTADVAQPSAEEVRADFDAHQAEMVSPERRKIRNVVVDSEAAAQKVLRSIRSGRPFQAVAAASSLDEATSQKGGLLGNVAAQDLDDAYAKAAFAAKPGVVFGPVRTASGWNVGLVESVTDSAPLAFADVKASLAEALWSDRKLKVWNHWLAAAIKAAHVEYADDYRPADPDAAPSMAPTAGATP